MNELKNEVSSYLLDHKDNPINWKSWGREAFKKAQEEDKPIFLSIGYASCHWCHVMNRETFMDQEVGDFLNQNFVSIKVDREEHPEIDEYYQLVGQITNGRGGWPLSVFLTPEGKPFFVGTYYPKNRRGEALGFMDVMQEMKKAVEEDKALLNTNADKITDLTQKTPRVKSRISFEGEFVTASNILHVMKKYEDEDYGGYGAPPKFPRYSFLEWAIEQILEGVIPEEQGRHILVSIEKMLMGGIYDQVRGGVHRYSTDEKWLVPHFEKMLYDQASFMRLVAKASLIFPSPLLFDALIQTLDYLETEMLSSDGFFFSSQDADSEGIEGLYFIFSKNEFLNSVYAYHPELKEREDEILNWFNIEERGNYDGENNVISLNHKERETFYKPENWEIIRKIKRALLTERRKRIPPRTDTKGIANYNFMMISALIDVIQYARVDVIREKASKLLNQTIEKIHHTFLKVINVDGIQKSRIINTTTNKEDKNLFENYVNFAEAQFRFYEISGNKTILSNAVLTLKFIADEFIQDRFIYTYSLKDNSNLIPNIHAQIADQAYKSAVATYILLLRKWSFIDKLSEIKEKISRIIKEMKQFSLTSPLSFGEMLRALTYPDIAYKKFDIPLTWLKESEFQNFISNFSARFVFNYKEEENEEWQICSLTECELKGTGLQNFLKVFKADEQK